MVKKPEAKKAEVVLATGKFVQIELADVIKVLAMINEHGQSKKLATKLPRKSAETPNEEKHLVRVPSATVNVVKQIVAAHPEMSQSTTGKKVLRPAARAAKLKEGCCDVGG